MGNDLISRQDAVDEVQAIEYLATLRDGDVVVKMNDVEHILYTMPSAQPERKRGKWIKGANHGLGVYTLTCDKCGYVDVSSNVINYCPNCGAKMEGEEYD